MRLLNYIIVISFISCVSPVSEKRGHDKINKVSDNSEKEFFEYLEKKVIDSLEKKGMLRFLDTSKLYFYTSYCDVKIDSLLKNENYYDLQFLAGSYLGSFRIRPTFIRFDTTSNLLNISLSFFVNDTFPLIGFLGKGLGNIPDGVNIDLIKGQYNSFSGNAMNFKRDKIDGNYESITPSTIEFINKNKNKMDTSFINLLIKNNTIKH